MRFAETMCGMPGPGQPRVVEPGMFLAIEPGEISAGLEQRRLEPTGDRPVGGGRGAGQDGAGDPDVVPAYLWEGRADADGGGW